MDRIEGVPEEWGGWNISPEMRKRGYEGERIEQPKQLEASDSELLDFLANQYSVDENGDATWKFCFSKNHRDFRSALRSWMREADRVTIREKGER